MFGQPLAHLTEITSTIDYARQWLREGAPHGAVVIAEAQSAGRGRLGRHWASPKGGLWLSLIARPGIDPAKAGRLGMAMAIASAEAISAASGCEALLKWPNDVMLEGKKVGGVLVEAVIADEHLTEAILSVGINVNVCLTELPEELRTTATSLLEETGRTYDLDAIAGRLLQSLDGLWPSVTGDGAALIAAWRRRDALADKEVTLKVAGKDLSGRAFGIDEFGRLRLSNAGGEQILPAGEVQGLRDGLGS